MDLEASRVFVHRDPGDSADWTHHRLTRHTVMAEWPTRHHYATAASPLSLSLESFPSLSSLSRDCDDDEDVEPKEDDGSPQSRLRTSWKPVVLAPLSSDEDDAYNVQCGDEGESSEDGEFVARTNQQLVRDTSDGMPDDSPTDPRGAPWSLDKGSDDEAVEADDEEPELSFRRRSSRPQSPSPVKRRLNGKEVGGRRQSERVSLKSQQSGASPRQIDRDRVNSSRLEETVTTTKGDVSAREETVMVQLRQQHFVACFVRVDPPLLRGLKHLELSGLNLKRTDLRSLAANLFLLEALRSISLEDNQLDDSCIKEIRMILSIEGLQHVNLSRNLLGRGTARMIADRLKHRLVLRSLDLTGNPWFFAFEDAADVARTLAQGLASNQAIVEIRLSLLVHHPHLERDRLVLAPLPPPQQQASSRAGKTHPPGKRNSLSDHDQTTSPGQAFTGELARELSVHPQSRALHSLGLVHAELSRASIVNLMKIANKLLVLDLSFAFAGIPSAQVIATALKMNDFATLTELNLRGNRLKTMGTRAIFKALQVNARLTSLNVSRNDIRCDILPDMAAMLAVNRTLVRLDLTQNQELFSGVEERSAEWKAAVKAMKNQGALRSLGDLNRIPARAPLRQAIQQQLEDNQQKSDNLVLLAVHQSMEFEAALAERSAKGSKPLPMVGSLQTISLSSGSSSRRTLWRLRTAVPKQARVSVKWKLQAFRSAAARGKNTRPHSPSTKDDNVACVFWRVILHRKCDIRGTVDCEAARGRFPASSSSTQGFGLCSALVYCEEGDFISISVSLPSVIDEEDGDAVGGESMKVLGKEFVVLPHLLTLRHILHDYDANSYDEHRGLSSTLQWQQKQRREPAKDPFTHMAELQRGCYIPRTAHYRVVWRVRLGSMEPSILAKKNELQELVLRQFYWKVLRSHCSDPETAVTMQEGSFSEFQGVVRGHSDLLLSAEPVELVAGENVHVHVETFTPEISIQLLQFYVLIETTVWESYGAVYAQDRKT